MREWFKRQWKDNQISWALAATLVCMVLAIIPLLVIATYNYPCADDFSYAGSIYQNLRAGAGLKAFLVGIWQEASTYYRDWQGRYWDNIVSCMGYGTAVPKYYFLGAWIVLLGLVLSSLTVFHLFFHRVCKWDSRVSYLLGTLVVIMQILYVPYPSEAFFWYVGATGYTGTYALILFGISAMICFYDKKGKTGQILAAIASILLAVCIAGSNFATALLVLEILVLALVICLIRRRSFIFLGIVTIIYSIGFVLNVFAPSNQNRMNNVEGMSPLQSIWESLIRGAVFTKEWLSIPVVIFLILLVLFSAHSIAKMKYQFKLPVIFTLVAFGLFSSMVTAPYFASRTWGPGRLINVMYYLYYLYLGGVVLYWTGWILHRFHGIGERFAGEDTVRKNAFIMILAAGVIMLGCIKFYGLQSTSSTSALLSLIKGEAAQYRLENEQRWQTLTDPSITDVVFTDFTSKPYVLYHDDVVADASDWRNGTLAGFFGKNSVKLQVK